MHPVIEHLQARAHSQGPFFDSRKIALVLWGGIMRSARGAGALLALEKLGLRHAFDSIYTVSAGFPLASYFLAGQVELGLKLFSEELVSPRFLNRLRFWQGMDVPFIIQAMRHAKPLDVSAIWQAKTKAYTRLVRHDTRELEYFEVHSLAIEEFWKVMQASISVPILYRHPVEIRGVPYIETNLNAYLKQHIQYVLASEHTDILCIYNSPSQRRIKFDDSTRILEICPASNWELSRFEKDPARLLRAADKMSVIVYRAFGHKKQ